MKKILMINTTIIFILITIFSYDTYALKNNGINFQSITIDDGLSQSLVETIYQDSRGYIWLGTGDGLNRYNGSEFVVYRNNKDDENSISNNSISEVVEDIYGNLWIGTYNGLNRMDLNTGKITRYLNSDTAGSISSNYIHRIVIDSKERVWICTDKGLNMYDYEEDKFIRVLEGKLSNEQIQDVQEDSKGRLWIATKNGLNMYDEVTGEVTKFFYDSNDINSISDNFIWNIYYSDNELWIGTLEGGLNKLNTNDYSIERYMHDPENANSLPTNCVMDIIKDRNDILWVATNDGLAAMNEDGTFTTYKKSISKYSISDSHIIELYEDNSGVMWVATYNGANIFKSDNNFETYRNDLLNDNSISNDSVCGIYEDGDGVIWVGTFGSGINEIDQKNNIIKRHTYSEFNNSISNDNIREITGIDNEIWIATDNGLNKYDKITGEFTVYKSSSDKNSLSDNSVRSLYIDKNGLLWIGTRGGICTFDRNGTFTRYDSIFEENEIYEKVVYDIFEDSDGIMWFGIGSNTGLVKYNRETGEMKKFKSEPNNKNSLSSNVIRSIAEDKNGYIWVGTQSGLNKFDKIKEEFTVYTTSDGLSNDFIYGVLVDDNNNIWASTNYGMSMYDSKQNNFKRYYITDGFATNEFNGFSYYKNKNGEMYFGGVYGLTKFNPLKIENTTSISNVVIDSINTSGGVKIDIDDNITLEYDSRELFVKFFIQDYKSINEIQYAYKMEGINDEWVFLGNQNYVRYASLEPGKYKMLIKGRNNNGTWSEITEVNIKVKNSPWKTPIAYFTYILIIVVLVFYIWNQVKILDSLVIQRTNELEKNLDKNKKLYQKLIETEKYKNNYFINLSHELRTPLNVILSVQQLITSLNSSGKNIEPEKMQSYMETLKGNSKRLLNLINNIIDTSKIDSGSYRLDKEEVDIVSLVENAALSMVELAELNKLELIIDPEIEEMIITCDKLEIERCIINLIGNAIKFTKPGGNITVRIIPLESHVKIIVKDTGVGIEEKYWESIFDRFGQAYNDVSEEFGGSGLGLTLTKNLINLHNGDISVISEKGKGSEFIIILPIR